MDSRFYVIDAHAMNKVLAIVPLVIVLAVVLQVLQVLAVVRVPKMGMCKCQARLACGVVRATITLQMATGMTKQAFGFVTIRTACLHGLMAVTLTSGIYTFTAMTKLFILQPTAMTRQRGDTAQVAQAQTALMEAQFTYTKTIYSNHNILKIKGIYQNELWMSRKGKKEG